jgi:hypothetical protein
MSAVEGLGRALLDQGDGLSDPVHPDALLVSGGGDLLGGV